MFGLAKIKSENSPMTYDEYCEYKSQGSTSTYMELCLTHGWDRDRVHREVEDWLNSYGWDTKPNKFPY